MTGIILCGGQSSRMGSDKGLLKMNNKTWVQIAFDKMCTLDISVKISVNKNQYEAYSSYFAGDLLITDNETLLLKGPLLGVLSCHLKFPNEDFFIMACDLPLMDITVLKKLYSLYRQNHRHYIYAFTNEGEPEPLCSIYTSSGLSKILSWYHSEKLYKHSMKYILGLLSVKTIPLSEGEKKYFKNFNDPSEIGEF